MADARLTALRGLNEVFGQGGYSNLVLESLMRKNELTGQERAFCTALFYGVVERRITLDWVLGRYSRQPVEKLSPAVRDILRKMTITDRLRLIDKSRCCFRQKTSRRLDYLKDPAVVFHLIYAGICDRSTDIHKYLRRRLNSL